MSNFQVSFTFILTLILGCVKKVKYHISEELIKVTKSVGAKT